MLTDTQHIILFWIFTGFFTIIGILALMAILGIIKASQPFRKWAVTGFVTGIAGVVFVWAKSTAPLNYYVILKPPPDIEVENFILEEGQYEYWDPSRSEPILGRVELADGGDLGTWSAKFPCKGMDRSVKLTVKDNDGQWWSVHPFYPNHNTRSLIKANEPENYASSFVFPCLAAPVFAQEPGIAFDNYARKILKRNDKTYFKWRIFVDEPDPVLDTIEEVQYLLHPTFAEPFQIRKNREDKFALERTGWGEFWIQITIKFKDGTTKSVRYYLDLSKDWP